MLEEAIVECYNDDLMVKLCQRVDNLKIEIDCDNTS